MEMADRVSDLMWATAGALFVILGLAGMIGTASLTFDSGAGRLVPLLISALFSVSFIVIGIYLIPQVHRWRESDHSRRTFGRVRTVDHLAFGDGADHQCVECGGGCGAGIVTRFRDQLVLAGLPVRTYAVGTNATCAECIDREQSMASPGRGDSTEIERAASR